MRSQVWRILKASFRVTWHYRTFTSVSPLRTMQGQPKVGPAKIIGQESYVVPGKIKITEYKFKVPLDYNNPNATQLQLFARSACNHQTPVNLEEEDKDSKDAKSKDQLPWLIYLTGGPGMHCQSPQDVPFTEPFLEKGYQLLMLDQRGTGLSSAVSADSLPLLARFQDDLKGPPADEKQQVEYLKLMRADNIVRDAEAIRQVLTADYPASKQKWSVIGHSYGGFCTVTYLSLYPQGLKEIFSTGGLPPLQNNPDAVYRSLLKRVARRNQAYYQKFPADVGRVKKIITFLHENQPQTPFGGILTPKRFMQEGIKFGFHGGLDKVHELVLQMTNDIDLFGLLTYKTFVKLGDFDSLMLYVILHESIYNQGQASNWSAERIVQEDPDFDIEKTLKSSDKPIYFRGEMIFPSMLDDTNEMRKVKNVANMLAKETSWPALYDREQMAKNEIPVYAVAYVDDMYVDFDFAIETANSIKGCKTSIFNQYYHEAVRSKTKEIVDALWNLRCDTID